MSMTDSWSLSSESKLAGKITAFSLVSIMILSFFSSLSFYGDKSLSTFDIGSSFSDDKGRNSGSVQLVDGWSRTGSGGATGQQSDSAFAVAVDDLDNIYVTGLFTGEETFGTHTILSSGGSDIFLGKISSEGEWLWVLSAGSSGDDLATSIAVDTSGNPVIAGYIGGTGDFGGNTAETLGGTEIVVAKAEKSGSWEWVTTAGGILGDVANDVTVGDDGSIYVTGQVEAETYNNVKYMI